MGNRAVIRIVHSLDELTTPADKSDKVGIYLHWNGGRDSIEPFLLYCKFKEYELDRSGLQKLVTVITNAMGTGFNVEIDKLERLDCDNFDNGVYVVQNWEIVGREFVTDDFTEQNEYNCLEFLLDIDSNQPYDARMGVAELSKKYAEYIKISNKL